MTIVDISLLRLYNQHLSRPDFKTPADVVRWFGALQAQDLPASLYAIGLRMPAATEAIIEQAVDNRSIVRSWPMRGTLHFMAAEDAGWIIRLLGPRLDTKVMGIYRLAGLSPDVLERAGEVLTNELKGGQQRTRPELYEALKAAGIETSMQARQQRGSHILGYWARRGLICVASRRGKQQTMALLEDWVPSGKDLTGDAALAELTTRYFMSHGPATAKDFAWWSGLTVTEASRGLRLVEHNFEHETVGGAEYWFSSTKVKAGLNTSIAYLLPAYDEYTVAYADRSAAIDPTLLSANGYGIAPNVVIGGRVVGTWKRVLKKDAVTVGVELFNPLDNSGKEALKTATERYGAFLGLKSVLNID